MGLVITLHERDQLKIGEEILIEFYSVRGKGKSAKVHIQAPKEVPVVRIKKEKQVNKPKRAQTEEKDNVSKTIIR